MENPDVKAIYPIHMNPAVRQAAEDVFGAELTGQASNCNRIRTA